MFYQISYLQPDGVVTDDFLYETNSIEKAKWYAEHRVNGSYGESSLKFKSVKRISKAKAQKMYDANCVSWVNSLY